MSTSAAQASSFYSESIDEGLIWLASSDDGPFLFLNAQGRSVLPVWSRQSRVKRVIESFDTFSAFQPASITLNKFRREWLSGFQEDGILVGINWAGEGLTGFDIAAADVELNFSAHEEGGGTTAR